MFSLLKKKVNLKQIEKIASILGKQASLGDLFLLEGDLGVGKTTFARYFINSVYKKNLIKTPKLIKSPTFPIMISYQLDNFEIYHFDLYRLKNKDELAELNVDENINKNITVVEWPELILKNLKLNNYFIISLSIINHSERLVQIRHNKIKEIIDGF